MALDSLTCAVSVLTTITAEKTLSDLASGASKNVNYLNKAISRTNQSKTFVDERAVATETVDDLDVSGGGSGEDLLNPFAEAAVFATIDGLVIVNSGSVDLKIGGVASIFGAGDVILAAGAVFAIAGADMAVGGAEDLTIENEDAVTAGAYKIAIWGS